MAEYRASLPKELSESVIFIGPSIQEGQGIVFVEAQAAGAAVVGTNVGGIPETFRFVKKAAALQVAGDKSVDNNPAAIGNQDSVDLGEKIRNGGKVVWRNAAGEQGHRSICQRDPVRG